LTLLLVLLSWLAITCFAQSTGGRIVGKVSDPTGAFIPDATVTITNEATGVSTTTQTDKSGEYSFMQVHVGDYSVGYEAKGFKKDVRRSVTLSLNQVLTLDATLALGSQQETVEVSSEAPLVDTTSTQLGAVVDDRSVTGLPLNSRDAYQFLQLQPGVQSNLGGSGTIIYGSDRPGVVSVNGGRGRANNFSVNGGDGNDQFANLPAIQPSPDSIQEFRVITNTFDAEYGRNSGSIVNVVTKSGTNQFHGSAYEFFRNTVLNARGYFDNVNPQFNQNQFGGTLGGPIKKDRAFFFASYEGRQVRQGVPTEQINVPTSAERAGDFSEGGLAAPFQGTLGTDGFVAQTLNQRPGCVTAIQAIGGVAPAPGANYSAVFPNNQIPLPCMDPTAVALMNLYVPLPNKPFGQYQSVPANKVGGTQVTGKFDYTVNNNEQFSAYYYYDDDTNF
jgi:Carboxypeptidase regulatory-like domain